MTAFFRWERAAYPSLTQTQILVEIRGVFQTFYHLPRMEHVFSHNSCMVDRDCHKRTEISVRVCRIRIYLLSPRATLLTSRLPTASIRIIALSARFGIPLCLSDT